MTKQSGRAEMAMPAMKEVPVYYSATQDNGVLLPNGSLSNHRQNNLSFGEFNRQETPQFTRFNSMHKNIEITEGLKAFLLEEK